MNGELGKPSETDLRTIAVCAGMVLLALIAYALLIPDPSTFFYGNMLVWMQRVVDRGLPAISAEFADYPPPYIYLMEFVAPLHIFFDNTVLLKILSAIFNFLGAVLVWLIIREYRDPRMALLSGAGFLLVPTVAVDSVHWAQIDIIYVDSLLAFFYCVLRQRPLAAMICLGAGFAFKLQGIFIGPFVLYLLLRKELRWRDLLAIPAVYLVAMVPANLAGRPWPQLLGIYTSQVGLNYGLSAQAPNLYKFVQKYNLVGHDLGTHIGEVLAAAGGLAISVFGLKTLGSGKQDKILIATAALILMPYLLPQMHERYFFAADVFSYVMAFAIARTWVIAVCMQCASFLAYSIFMFDFGPGPYLGALFTTAALVLIYRVWLRQSGGTDGSAQPVSA